MPIPWSLAPKSGPVNPVSIMDQVLRLTAPGGSLDRFVHRQTPEGLWSRRERVRLLCVVTRQSGTTRRWSGERHDGRFRVQNFCRGPGI
jgi:hypothetical protein